MLNLLLLLATAIPQPSASPACATPHREATVKELVPPQWPRGYYTAQPVEVVLQLTIGEDGSITAGHVTQSSGVAAYDAAAAQSAEESRFEPKLVDCKATVGTYLFKVTFRSH